MPHSPHSRSEPDPIRTPPAGSGAGLPSGRALAALAADYARDGVVAVRGVVDAAWIEFLAGAIDDAMRQPGPHAEDYEPAGGGGRFFGDLDLAARLPAFAHWALGSPCAGLAGRIMGASVVRLFYDQLLVKEPGTAARTPWHQDQPYWAVRGRQVCTVWVPVDPVPEDVAVEFVAGSHQWPEYSPYHFADGSAYAGTGLPALPDVEAARATHRILRFALQPGDALVFQAMIVHGAPGNAGMLRRRALATRWLGDDARFARRPGEVAIPTRDPGLADGAPFDHPDFPVCWPVS